jgi:hypothetical protein
MDVGIGANKDAGHEDATKVKVNAFEYHTMVVRRAGNPTSPSLWHVDRR